MDDFKQLEDLNHSNIAALEEIVGYTRHNKKASTKTERALRAMGNYWALHVLETPMSWIMSAAYILITITTGNAIAGGIAKGVLHILDAEHKVVSYPYNHVVAVVDAIIYIFLPQWTMLILRAVTGWRFLHQMVGRSVVIGDIPWVAQCVEAYLSKLFACAYSAASISVYSANPSDHLVHRMTHRVVRGALLACGRPDGRLMALTSAEASVCLSVNQASSIQSIGSTCESLNELRQDEVGRGCAPQT